jgi:hypothetical protein
VSASSGIEAITINGLAGAGDALVVLGTHDDDTFALQRTGGANRVWLNDRAVVTFNDEIETVTLNGRFGSDTFSVHSATLVGVTTVNVIGGDPTASDTVVINGTAGQDDVNFAATAADAMTITGLGPQIEVTAIEHVIYNGQGGQDDLTFTTPAGPDEVVFTPGSQQDSGTIQASRLFPVDTPLLGLTYLNVGAVGTLTFADAGAPGDRPDVLVVHGTANNDRFDVTSTGQVQIDRASAPGIFTTVLMETPGIGFLGLAGFDGDDVFNIDGNHPFAAIAIEGGNPSASDVLNFTGSGANPVIIDLEGLLVVEAGFGPVLFTGVEIVNVDAGFEDVLVFGTAGDDDLSYTPTGFDAGTLVLAGLNTVFHISAAFLILDPLGGVDTVTVHGNSADNDIAVLRGTPTTVVTVDLLLPIILDSDNTAALVVSAGLGDDAISVFGSGGPASLTIDGGLPTASDTLIIVTGTDATVTVSYGTDPSSGVVGDDVAGNVAFVNIEHLELTGQGGDTSLTVNGTNGDDAINQSGNIVTVNDGAVVEFTGYPTLNLNGHAGSDTINVHPDTLIPFGVTTLNIDGGDPTASDTVVINGTAGQDTVNVTPTAIDAATVAGLGPVVNVSAAEHLIYSGLGGDDLLTITATVDDDTIVHTPGETADAGRLRVNSLLALDYVNLGAGGSVTVDGDAGDDRLVYLGSSQGGDFTVSAAGEVDYEDAVVHVTVGTTDVENLELDASASGTTLFSLNAGYPYDTVTLIGSNHSGSLGDVAQLNGDGTALTIAPTAVNDQIDVTGGGLGAVTLYGIENLEVDAGGGDVTYNGNAADNDVTVSPSAADAAGIAHAGLDAQINVANVASLLVDLLGGSNSLTVLGTQGDDAITVTGAQVAVNLLLPVDYLNVQSLSVLGGDGSDTFTVTPSATTSIFIDGGDPIGGDRGYTEPDGRGRRNLSAGSGDGRRRVLVRGAGRRQFRPYRGGVAGLGRQCVHVPGDQRGRRDHGGGHGNGLVHDFDQRRPGVGRNQLGRLDDRRPGGRRPDRDRRERADTRHGDRPRRPTPSGRRPVDGVRNGRVVDALDGCAAGRWPADHGTGDRNAVVRRRERGRLADGGRQRRRRGVRAYARRGVGRRVRGGHRHDGRDDANGDRLCGAGTGRHGDGRRRRRRRYAGGQRHAFVRPVRSGGHNRHGDTHQRDGRACRVAADQRRDAHAGWPGWRRYVRHQRQPTLRRDQRLGSGPRRQRCAGNQRRERRGGTRSWSIRALATGKGRSPSTACR